MIFAVKVPMVGESITEVVMGEWKKADSDYVEVDEPICVIESEKAAMDIAAEKAGQLRIKAKTGDTLKIGELIAEIDMSVRESAAETGEISEETTESRKTFLTSTAKKMLEEAGIPPEEVQGSGPVGRITKADAQRTIEAQKEKTKEVPVEKEEEKKIHDTRERKESREPMSTLRRTIASHLVAAKNETAMLTTINEIDMSAILKLREELKEEFFDKYGVKLGFMSLFGRAVCIALKEMPVVNAGIEENDIVYHHYVDLSLAVSTPRGLVAPVANSKASFCSNNSQGSMN